ncbi:hypothetical protein [Carp edema virus]|nr:hypothetical protein [Carp edema virus]
MMSLLCLFLVFTTAHSTVFELSKNNSVENQVFDSQPVIRNNRIKENYTGIIRNNVFNEFSFISLNLNYTNADVEIINNSFTKYASSSLVSVNNLSGNSKTIINSNNFSTVYIWLVELSGNLEFQNNSILEPARVWIVYNNLTTLVLSGNTINDSLEIKYSNISLLIYYDSIFYDGMKCKKSRIETYFMDDDLEVPECLKNSTRLTLNQTLEKTKGIDWYHTKRNFTSMKIRNPIKTRVIPTRHPITISTEIPITKPTDPRAYIYLIVIELVLIIIVVVMIVRKYCVRRNYSVLTNEV